MTWLLEAGMRSGLLVVIVASGLGIMRVASLQLQNCVWRIVLFACLSMPVLQGLGALAPAAATNVRLPFSPPGLADFPVARLHAAIPLPVDRDHRLASWLAPADAVVSLLFLIRIALGLALGARLCRRAEPLEDAHEAARIRISREIGSPAVFGRTILLPASCASWSAQGMRAVLAHERSHLRHGDFFILLLASIHRAVFWFNPAAWWLLRRLALLAEARSDDASIAALGGPRPYLEILAHVAGNGRAIALSIPMASTDTLRRRLHRIERGRFSPELSAGRAWSIALLSTGAAVLLAIRAGQPDATGTGRLSETVDAIAQRRYEQARPRRAVPVDPAMLVHWTGSFRISPIAAMTISSADGHVYARITGQERTEIFPDAEGELFFRNHPAQMTFTGAATSPAPAMILHEDGGEAAYPRLFPDAAAALARRFAERLRNDQPQPGSAAALRHALENGPDDARMSPGLAAALRKRSSPIWNDLHQAGMPRSISFAGVGHGGCDVYDVRYEHAAIRARILLGDDGRIDQLFLEYLP